MSESEWHPSRLGDDVDLLTGYPFQSKYYSEAADGIRLLRGDNIAQGRLRWDGMKRWPTGRGEEVAAYQLAEGDVVLAMDRPWIEAGLKYSAVGRDDLPCLLVQRVARLRGGPRLHTGYLRYLIGSKEFTDYVLAVQTGTAVPHISGDQIKAFRFLRPPLWIQKRIAYLLGSLDDKIDSNCRMNRTLEALARAIFRSWFVDFDPVRAKVEGRSPAGMDAATAALFPEHFEDSELGKIPTGWKVLRLEEVAEARKGLSYKGAGLSDEGVGVPMHNLNSVHEGGGYKYEGIKFYTSDFDDRHKLYPGELIVANTEQGFDYLLIGYPAIVPRCFGDFGIFTHHIYRVRPRPGSGVTSRWLYHLLMSDSLRDVITGYTNGTTVNMLAIDGLQKPFFVLPPARLLKAFEKIADPMARQAERNREESRTLAALRDALLPRLISGELRVPEAERLAGSAT